jgi:hypothetical protein
MSYTKKLISAKQAAEILNLSPKTVHNGGAGTSHLKRARFGRSIRFLLSEVESLRDRGFVNHSSERSKTPYRARGYLYAIQMMSPDGHGPIKLGHSADPQRRLKDFSHAAPFPLKLLATWPVKHIRDEAALHEQFLPHKLEGEWFKPVPELLDFLQRHADLA